MVPIIAVNVQFVRSSGSSVHVCNRAVVGSNPGGEYGVLLLLFKICAWCPPSAARILKMI